jgi:tRNA(Ile)-lysidine synthase
MAERRPPQLARVLERVTRTARAHAMFAPGDLVLVWVSGGADSLCLLESLNRLRRLLRIRLAVFHLDHGLRPSSSADAAYVRRRAAAHDLPCLVATPSAPPPAGASVERWAREERRAAAGRVAADIGAARSALGHTADDRAETVLLGLVRGWGLDGLTGIEPVAGRIVRPLLDVRRDETVAACRSLGLRPREDPTNADTAYLRNAIRHDVLPALANATGRDVVPAIVRSAELLRADASMLDDLATGLLPAVLERDGGAAALRVDALADLAPPVASRVVRHALASVGIEWTAAAIDGVLDLVRGRVGRTRALADGWTARRSRAHVVLER